MRQSSNGSKTAADNRAADSKRLSAAGKPEESGKSKELAPGLYITATPIGHAQDISLRALWVLAQADLIAAEDTRVTAKLLQIHGLSKPLTPYNDHNAVRERPRLIEKLKRGARIALVSDAGTPLVSDPGYKLVREVLQADIPVHAVPGASAVLAGLTLSGLPSDRFLFAGFLSAKAGERDAALEELKGLRATLIFFESGPRLAGSLAAMARILGPRPAAVARELTKLHEEVRRASLNELAAHYAAAPPKGEVTLLVGPPLAVDADWGIIDRALDAALPFMPVKAAAEMIAGLTGASRKTVYDRALDRKDGGKKNG
jgi:16S rRNA (cytidine1402-2'-O)-methyltransferase